MRRVIVAAFTVLALLLVAGAVAILGVVRHGVSARDRPTLFEAALARRLRHLATPRSARELTNPVPLTPQVLEEARRHFADHCALCHGNDGSGRTEIGRRLYPPAPDMREAATQRLSDGEVFSIIQNGVRLTGMPAWGSLDRGDTEDTWKLVHFVRHLPSLSPGEIQEMAGFNPRSRNDMKEEKDMEDFLEGRDPPAEPPAH